jgi:hypothetical protein
VLTGVGVWGPSSSSARLSPVNSKMYRALSAGDAPNWGVDAGGFSSVSNSPPVRLPVLGVEKGLVSSFAGTVVRIRK